MLRRKLEMKSEALILLSEELEQCRIQRDQFKTMAEQLQERLLHLKKQMCDRKDANRYLIRRNEVTNMLDTLFYICFLVV